MHSLRVPIFFFLLLTAFYSEADFACPADPVSGFLKKKFPLTAFDIVSSEVYDYNRDTSPPTYFPAIDTSQSRDHLDSIPITTELASTEPGNPPVIGFQRMTFLAEFKTPQLFDDIPFDWAYVELKVIVSADCKEYYPSITRTEPIFENSLVEPVLIPDLIGK